MKLHFLNVGHGDCTFVEFPSGRLMMVDINNSRSMPTEDKLAMAERNGMSMAAFVFKEAGKRSWSDYYDSLLVDPFDYYIDHFSGRSIFRYVQTHPDMDHMSGLHRFFWKEGVSLLNFWDIAHTKVMDDSAFDTQPHALVDWQVYRNLRIGQGPTDTHKVITNLRGESGQYWDDDHMAVLSPSQALVNHCNDTTASWNDASYVLRLAYAGRSVILGGDAESTAWDDINDCWAADVLACDILKASHHGRESGYNAAAVEVMGPSLVICSVGEKPTTDASDEYKAAGATVLSTRFNGTITVTISDSGVITVEDTKGKSLWEKAA